MTPTAPVFRDPDVYHQRGNRRSRLGRADIRVARRADGPAQRDAEGTPLPWSSSCTPVAAGIASSGENGHLSGLVQSVERPALLEIWGPFFMSTAATSNLQYGSARTRRHAHQIHTHTRGAVPEDHRPKLATGCSALHTRVLQAAEAAGK